MLSASPNVCGVCRLLMSNDDDDNAGCSPSASTATAAFASVVEVDDRCEGPAAVPVPVVDSDALCGLNIASASWLLQLL